MMIEDTLRPIIITVLFGLTLIAAIVALVLVLWKPRPSWASVAIAFLWFLTALLMIVGAGLFSGGLAVAEDSCLYIETYTIQYVLNKVDAPAKREWVSLSFKENTIVPGRGVANIRSALHA